MPRLQGRHNGVQHSCPDEESLCAYAEDRAGGVVRDGIAAHLKECESCAGLCQRLLEFARPSIAVPEDEWANAEKRLGNWMDGFLLAETRRAAVAVEPVAVYSAPRVGWFSAWKLRWIYAAAAALVASVGTYLVIGLQVATKYPADLPTVAQVRQQAPSHSPTPTEVTSDASQADHLSAKIPPNTNPPAPERAQPAAPNQNAPQSTQTYAYVPKSPPDQGEQRRADNHSYYPYSYSPGFYDREPKPARPTATSNPSNQPSGAASDQQAPANSADYQYAAVITPEIKAAVADEVKLELASYQAYAANPHPQETANGNQMPGALDPKLRTFIVSAVLTEQTTDGTQCSLSPGDILTRIMDTPDTNVRVTALVTSSQRNDCATGSLLAISVWELQNMHNDFAQKIDAGLQKLADNEGKNGMPAGPLPGQRTNPDGQAQPDITASADLQQQLQDADNAEKDVSQAAAGITPSSFHPFLRRPADSEHFSSFGDDSLWITRSTKPESGELTLIAWHPYSQPSNAHPQQTVPAKPAPAPKKSSPPPPSAAPKPAPAQVPKPPSPPRNNPVPTQRPTNAAPPKPPATVPRNNANPRALPGSISVPNSNRGAKNTVPTPGPVGTRLPDGGSRETRADGSRVSRSKRTRNVGDDARWSHGNSLIPNGHLSAINFRSSKGYETEVSRGPGGTRTIRSEHVNERGERIING